MNALVAFRSKVDAPRSVSGAPRMDGQRHAHRTAPAPSFGLKANSVSTTADGGAASRVVNQELSRDAFLQLLVLQMQHQNPLEPVGNEAMLAQLAQFSSLEQMSNLNESFEVLSGNIDQLNFISASNLLGRRISGIDMDGQPREGVVERVHLDGSIVYLTVDGALMSMAGVIGIGTGHGESSPTTTGSGE